MVGREELVTSLAERLQDGALYHWEVLHGELHPLHVALFRLLRRGPVNSRLEDSVPLKRHAQRQAHAAVAVWER